MLFFPLTRPVYETMVTLYRWFPIVLPIQLSTTFYPSGKTSLPTLPLNIPGKLAWMTMELCSPTIFLTTLLTSPNTIPLPSKILAACFLTHYAYRAVISPLMNPSMAPINLLIMLMAMAFNTVNPSTIAGWLSNITGEAARVKLGPQFLLGVAIWALGFAGNIYHEERLREIRRPGGQKLSEEQKKSVVERRIQGRLYQVPKGGLFEYCFHAHYLSEWIEWTGFVVATGGRCTPAFLFVVAELATMLPRAVQGKKWYKEKFGKDLPERYAAIPGII